MIMINDNDSGVVFSFGPLAKGLKLLKYIDSSKLDAYVYMAHGPWGTIMIMIL